jgi:CHAT domain
VLAEYYLAGGMLTLFVVAPGVIGPAPEVIEYPRDEMMRFIQSAFGTGSGTEGAAPPMFDEAEFQSLFRPFIAPIAKYCRPGDLLWIVPHDFLHYVPLHAVEIDGQPLIARNPVVYTPSASVLPRAMPGRQPRGGRGTAPPCSATRAATFRTPATRRKWSLSCSAPRRIWATRRPGRGFGS